MPGSLIQSLWSTWERIFHRLWHVQPISDDGPYLFYISEQRYLGHKFEVDGVTVSRFDKVFELHMNNELIVHILREQKSAVSIAVRLLQEAKRAFPAMSRFVSKPEYDHIKVMYGVTFINRSVERFGFHTFPIRRRLLAGMTTWYLKKLFVIVNPLGAKLIQDHPETLVPRVVAISRARFLEEFPADTSDESNVVPASEHVPS